MSRCACQPRIDDSIDFCALHLAAPELYEACKEVSELAYVAPELLYERFVRVMPLCAAALRKADGQ